MTFFENVAPGKLTSLQWKTIFGQQELDLNDYFFKDIKLDGYRRELDLGMIQEEVVNMVKHIKKKFKELVK